MAPTSPTANAVGPVAQANVSPFLPFNTYRQKDADNVTGTVDCGSEVGYQVQNMSSFKTSIKLLNDVADPKAAPDPDLVALAKVVNKHFEPLAKAALKKKRDALVAAKMPDVAARTEITVLLTDHGLQLGWSRAIDRKEIAPAPKKPFLRRILGPLYPGRKFWVMPETDKQKAEVYTVRWPWLFWLGVLLAILGALAWSFTAGPLK